MHEFGDFIHCCGVAVTIPSPTAELKPAQKVILTFLGRFEHFSHEIVNQFR